jgi:hypothetical protein
MFCSLWSVVEPIADEGNVEVTVLITPFNELCPNECEEVVGSSVDLSADSKKKRYIWYLIM